MQLLNQDNLGARMVAASCMQALSSSTQCVCFVLPEIEKLLSCFLLLIVDAELIIMFSSAQDWRGNLNVPFC